MRQTRAGSEQKRQRISGWLIAYQVLTVIAVVVVGWTTRAVLISQARSHAQEQLTMVASQRARQVETWLQHERLTTESIARGSAMALAVEEWLTTGVIRQAELERCQRRLITLAETNRFESVAVASADGRILMETSPSYEWLGQSGSFIGEAFRSGSASTATLHLHSSHEKEHWSVMQYVPVIAVDALGARPVAVMVTSRPLETALAALFDDEPGAIPASDVVLAERKGDKVIRLFSTGVPVSSSRELAVRQRDSLLVQSALGAVGLLDGIGERRSQAVGVGRRVGSTNLYVVAQRERSALYQSLWPRTLAMSGLILLYGLMAFVAIGSWMRQRASGLLVASEARYRELFESIADAVFIVGERGAIIEANQVACERLGYSRERLLSMTAAELEEATEHARPVDWLALLRERDPIVDERRYVDVAKMAFPVEIHARPITFRGQPAALLSARDITQRKRTELRLAVETQFSRALVDAANAIVIVTGADGRIREWNPAASQITGYRASDFVGRNWYDVLLPRERYAAHWTRKFRWQDAPLPVEFESPILTADGAERYIVWQCFQLNEDDSGPNTVTLGFDITARRHAEENLLQRERFLKTVTDAFPGVVGYWDSQLRCRFANPGYLGWFGRSPEEMLEVSLYELFDSELRAKNERHVEGVLAGEAQHFERRLIRPDQSVGYASVHYLPDVADGKVRGFFVIATDISEQKQAQFELQALNAALEERSEQAEAANRAKSAFLANMSHELRTPMNAVLGFCHLVLQTELSPRQRDYTLRIQDSSRLLLGVLNDVLDLSRVEANKLTIEETEFELWELIERVRTVAAERATLKGLTLAVVVAAEVPKRLRGDPLRLSQILVNMTNNALKFTEQGSVSLSVSSRSRDTKTCVLRFVVTDSGIGIDAETLSRLFQSFTQGDSSTTRKYGGSGLGLAICKHLTELMGGTIGVTSEVGVGSEFVVELPFLLASDETTDVLDTVSQEAPRTSLVAVRTSHPKRAARGRILLVEDNENNRIVAGDLLELEGYEVTAAHNGREAVEFACQPGARFDLILMDIQMPVMDGRLATRQIRTAGIVTPIVAMTAHALDGERQRCVEAGMDDHLTKPFEPDDLRRVLSRWLPVPVDESQDVSHAAHSSRSE